MSIEDAPTSGRARLDVASYAADLSGKDFENVYLDRSQTLSHSFLNGSSFKNSAFIGAPIDQTELAEAQIVECLFDETDFTGSSFIGAIVKNTTFRKCIFADGEWRKSRFTNVTFKDCNFHYTTVNLCIFENCEFYGPGSKQLDNRSVNYNVFTECRFDTFYEDDVVLAHSFGLPSYGEKNALVSYGSHISLEEVCIQSSSGRVTVSDLVLAIQNEFATQRAHKLKTMRLEFVSNILAALANTKKISAASLTYLEGFFSSLAKAATSEVDALAAMSVVLNIRNLLFAIIPNVYADSEIAACQCDQVDIEYQRSYTMADSVELAKILGQLTIGDPNAFVVSRFSHGSTLIELLAAQVVGVGAVLTSLNFVLRQINTTLVQAQQIRKNTAKLRRPSAKVVKKPRRNVSRIRALQRSGQFSKEELLLRKTVALHGFSAVVLDDEAQTRVHYVSNK